MLTIVLEQAIHSTTTHNSKRTGKYYVTYRSSTEFHFPTDVRAKIHSKRKYMLNRKIHRISESVITSTKISAFKILAFNSQKDAFHFYFIFELTLEHVSTPKRILINFASIQLKIHIHRIYLRNKRQHG